MVKLAEIVHVALDELRMQMLGTQVLFGFQLQVVFQESFDGLPRDVRFAAAAALTLIVITLGLLIAAPSQHRLTENGEATVRIFHVANGLAKAALVTFGLAIGCDLFVVTDQYWGLEAGMITGVTTVVVTLSLWYGLGNILRALIPSTDRRRPLPPESPTDLHAKIEQMLTEARVVLPGAQALLGFQFIVTMSKTFAALSILDRDIHFAALSAVALAMILLLTPAAVHRLTFEGRDLPLFHDIGSTLVTIALAPLAFGISADFYIAASKMLDSRAIAAIAATAIALLLFTLWYVIPFSLRVRRQGKLAA